MALGLPGAHDPRDGAGTDHGPGEVIRRVGGLKIPSDTDTGESSEAVQLFIERARSHEPEFESGEAELAEIAHVTHRLDGIPWRSRWPPPWSGR